MRHSDIRSYASRPCDRLWQGMGHSPITSRLHLQIVPTLNINTTPNEELYEHKNRSPLGCNEVGNSQQEKGPSDQKHPHRFRDHKRSKRKDHSNP